MNANVQLTDLPGWAIALLVVAALVQLGVEVYALVRLAKTPDERLVFGKKWPWVLIILFVNLIGAIVFLAAGTTPAPAADPLAPRPDSPDTAERASRAVDALYGPKGGAV